MNHLDNCEACNGAGIFQINEPLQSSICIRCHGTGKDRIVQIFDTGSVSDCPIVGLTANGAIISLEWKENERRC